MVRSAIAVALRLACTLLAALAMASAGYGDQRAIDQTATDTTATGEPIADFALTDAAGQTFQLSQHADAPAVCIVFLGTECPLARLYLPRLVELNRQFVKRGVVLFGVCSNVQDAPEEIQALAAEFALRFPLYKDSDHRVADLLQAERTPEAFLLDRARVVRYRGPIDDQYGIDFQRPAPQQRLLADAVAAVLADENVAQPRLPAPGCLIGRARTANMAASVTWSARVGDIVQRRCQNCHRPGELAPFSLLTYEDAAAWHEMIGEVVGLRRMPPWHADPSVGKFSNDPRLTDEERETLLAWVDCGAPHGDATQDPSPREFAPGWKIGEPDQVVYMSERPIDVPAEGTVAYQWLRVDPGFTEDKWIRAAEARPGCAAVVHHVTVYHEPAGVTGDLRLNDRINLLGGYNPGGDPWNLPAGAAMRVPAGSQIVFEMHYTPNGLPQLDRSYIGLAFARPEDVTQEVICVMPANTRFAIPPGAANHEVGAEYTFPVDVDLLLMRPHMHLRGRSFQYDVVLPDDRHQRLLNVPRYDFSWQHSYVLAEPLRLPAGTRLVCSATFDNSAENRSNPDPKATVRWGDQSWEEMMIGIVMVRPVDRQAAAQADWRGAAAMSWRRSAALMGICLAAMGCLVYAAMRWAGRSA